MFSFSNKFIFKLVKVIFDFQYEKCNNGLTKKLIINFMSHQNNERIFEIFDLEISNVVSFKKIIKPQSYKSLILKIYNLKEVVDFKIK